MIYKRLDVTSVERGESFYQSRMVALVQDLKKKDVMKFEDGRYILFGEGQDVPLTIVKSDGGFTYGTSDMAALTQRAKEEKADWVIYVVDAGQSQHLETVYAAGRDLGIYDPAKSQHLETVYAAGRDLGIYDPAKSQHLETVYAAGRDLGIYDPAKSQHLETVYAAARDLGIYDPAKVRVDHCAFGVVCSEDGSKLKTRSGETIRLVDLLDEGLSRAKDTLKAKGRDSVLSAEEFEGTAAAVAYGCIKYADLSHNRTKNYIFSFDKMLDDRGNTAVYLLYAYTRIRSIARTAGVDRQQLLQHAGSFTLSHEKELKLAKTLLKFWDAVASVVDDLYLNTICDYLYDVACRFTEFYDVCYCVQKLPDGEVKIDYNRLILAETTADIIKSCFNVLGIRTVERM